MDNIPLYCASLSGYAWLCGLKNTDIKLKTTQDKELILVLKIIFRGNVSSVMGHRYVKLDDKEKILYIDANILCGYAISESLPFDEMKFDKKVQLEDDGYIGYFVEVGLKNPDNKKEKTKKFILARENKKINPDEFTPYMNENKPNTYTQSKKLICDWTEKRNF